MAAYQSVSPLVVCFGMDVIKKILTFDCVCCRVRELGKRRSWRVAADCKSVALGLSWFESILPHQLRIINTVSNESYSINMMKASAFDHELRNIVDTEAAKLRMGNLAYGIVLGYLKTRIKELQTN